MKEKTVIRCAWCNKKTNQDIRCTNGIKILNHDDYSPTEFLCDECFYKIIKLRKEIIISSKNTQTNIKEPINWEKINE